MILAGSIGVASAVFIEENMYGLKYHILCLCVSVHLFLCEGIALLVKTVEGVMSDEARDMIMRVHQMIQIQKTLHTVMNQMTKRKLHISLTFEVHFQ